VSDPTTPDGPPAPAPDENSPSSASPFSLLEVNEEENSTSTPQEEEILFQEEMSDEESVSTTPAEQQAREFIEAVQNIVQMSTPGTAPTTPSTATQNPVNVPTMGGLTSDSNGSSVAWTGGKPTPNWTQLHSSAPTVPTFSAQCRMAKAHHSAPKAYTHRTTGLSPKFSKTSDLKTFQEDIWEHFKTTGLDTIAYVPDPGNALTRMISCVTDHARLSVDHVSTHIVKQQQKYDEYDKANDAEATKYLLNSIDDSLLKEIRNIRNESDAFPVLFMHLIGIVRSVSIDRFNRIKKQIENRHPSQYAGEDLAQMSQDFLTDANELEIAGQYDHNLTLNMLEAFLEGGGKEHTRDAEDYRHELRNLKETLNKKLPAIAFLESSDATKVMAAEHLTFRDICRVGTDRYRAAVSRGKWPPARHNPDSKAAPAAFGNLGLVTPAQVNALIQQAINKRDHSNDKCNNCGTLGHWARDCPRSKTHNRNKQHGGRGGNQNRTSKHNKGNNGGRGRGRGDNRNSWKNVPPGPGESTSKKVGSDTWQWCAKCTPQRWSRTHGTDTHTGPTRTQPQANTLRLDASTIQHSAWHTAFIAKPSFVDLLGFCLKATGWLVVPLLWVTLGILAHNYVPFSVITNCLWLHWQTTLAGLHWMGLLLWTFYLHNLHTTPVPKERPPPKPRWMKRNGRKFQRKRHRWTRKQLIPVEPRGHISTEEHRRRALDGIRRQKKFAHARETSEFLQQIVDFEEKLRFRRSSMKFPFEEGEQHNTTQKKWHKKRKPRPLKHPKFVRDANFTPGITEKQVRALKTPAARAFIANHDAPSHLTSLYQALKSAFASPQATRDAIDSKKYFDVIWDSGASISISHCKSDFTGPIESVGMGITLQGIAKGVRVMGKGTVNWSFTDNTGQLRTLSLDALYVPTATARLLSTSSLLDRYPNEHITQHQHRLVLSGDPTVKDNERVREAIEILIDPQTNLPIGFGYANAAKPAIYQAMQSAITTVSDSNKNLSTAEKELLRWHYRLSHLSFKQVQFLMRTGVLAHSEGARRRQTTASKLTDLPLCAACQFGKQRRRTPPGIRRLVVKDSDGALKKDKLFPGQMISVDHFVCSTRGRLTSTYGKEDSKSQYCGGAIFVDHASGYLFVKEQVHLNTHETIEAKQLFEQLCRDVGVVPQTYLSDNGTSFTSQSFTSHLEEFRQVKRLAGVGAHHHNGIAERAIGTVMSVARASMLHAAIHWPDVADTKLWPLAVQHAAFLYNHMPKVENGLSPLDLFTRTRWPHAKFHDLHVWGCPVYVLDKTIADGKKLPCWKPRSGRHMYMGTSPKHATSAPLTLNLDTGAIGPQFHIVFDDWFSTIAASTESLPDFGSDAWEKLFGDSTHQYIADEDDTAEFTSDDPPPLLTGHREAVAQAFEESAPAKPLPMLPPPQNPITVASPTQRESPMASLTPLEQRELPQEQRESELPSSQLFIQREKQATAPLPSILHPQTPLNPFQKCSWCNQLGHSKDGCKKIWIGPPSNTPSLETSSAPTTPKRSNTSSSKKVPRNETSRDIDTAPPKYLPSSNSPAKMKPPLPPREKSTRIRKPPTRLGFDDSPAGLMTHFSSMYYQAMSVICPSVATALKAKATKDPDTLTFDEAMRCSPTERLKWLEAMQIEIEALIKLGTWVEVPMSEAKGKIIPLTWTLRRKRAPDGSLKKYKGRICVRGDLEEKKPTSETYAPVTSQSSVRLFLTLSLILGWSTCSIDFANAFVQSYLKTPIWTHLPRGYTSSNGSETCLRLVKSLYGTSVAPALWFDTAMTALKALGFKSSATDPCFLYTDRMMIVLYVDDAGIAAKDPKDIDWLIAELKKKGFNLTKEGTFAEFLGIKFEQLDSNEFRLTQPGLIQKVIEATNLVDCKSNLMPTTQQALSSDVEGPPMTEEWKYSSVVGMLLYLSGNSRPDIAFAVSQVCRFSSDPKQSHATAVKTIVRYLKGTANQGMILRPTGRLDLDLYVDADFCSLHGLENSRNPDSARSRTGFIVMLSDCPLLWKSQLQTHISLSTLEAEYSALSYALKTLLPLKRLLVELMDALDVDDELRTSVQARAFEDNQGALILAQEQRITNRTKYFLVKWHWFWEFAKEFIAKKVSSENQRGDFLTKPLPRQAFEHNRLLVQGW